MPLAVSVQLHVPTKDPREAVIKCLKLVREKSGSQQSLQIDLGLTCMKNSEVLDRLAAQLPSAALGFRRMGSDRAVTASEFQDQGTSDMSFFHGVLTEHFLAADALSLIEKLLQSSPRAIRSTAFNLNLGNIHWKGTPSGVVGSLHLFDFKAFKRAQRFSLSACLHIPTDDPKSPETRELRKQVAQATEIPFDSGHISRVPGAEARSPARGQAILVGQVCFDEAIESLTAIIPRHWVPEFAPHALRPNDAFGQRLQQWGGTSGGKVNLLPLLKRAAKRALPAFRFEIADRDQIWFVKRMDQDLEIVVLFEKEMPRIGKAFSLSLGIRAAGKQMRFTSNVFQLAWTTEQRIWIYPNAQEAEAAVLEAVNLATELLPRFESCMRQYFEPWPAEFPARMERHGGLTAREAFAKAEPLARNLFSDAILIRLGNQARSLEVREIDGPELSFDGRLIPNASWWFHFYSTAKDASFAVTVPALGRIRIVDHGAQYRGPDTSHWHIPADRNWMDSSHAFALAEERGGRERRASGKIFGLIATMQRSPAQGTYWKITYLVIDERGRNDLIVNLDAITGEPLSDTKRF